jgi:hypothetical protein
MANVSRFGPYKTKHNEGKVMKEIFYTTLTGIAVGGIFSILNFQFQPHQYLLD